MRRIDEIIVHCTATPEGRAVTVADIDRWHKERGWECIGYHYVVYLDGSIHGGRPEAKAGAHCVNHNRNSIGVVYVGGCDADMKPKDTRTTAQKKALRQLLKLLRGKYPSAKIRGHRDFAKKDCPSFDARHEYAYI